MKYELKLKWQVKPYDLTDAEGNKVRKFILDNPPSPINPWGNPPPTTLDLILSPNGPDNPIPINAISALTMTNGKYTEEIKIDPDGTISCWRDGRLHREDGSATMYPDGRKAWYKDGELHREDGPAAEFIDGTKMWFIHDKLHREDGPAIVYHTGQSWYIKGNRIN
jgi:hypothetical protein